MQCCCILKLNVVTSWNWFILWVTTYRLFQNGEHAWSGRMRSLPIHIYGYFVFVFAKLWFLREARRGNSSAVAWFVIISFIKFQFSLLHRDFRGLCKILHWSHGSLVIQQTQGVTVPASAEYYSAELFVIHYSYLNHYLCLSEYGIWIRAHP